MNKKIISILSVLAVAGSIALSNFAYGGVDTAVTYLNTKTPDAWITMALIASGRTADVSYISANPAVGSSQVTEVAKYVLALVAAGANPHTQIAGTDLVIELKGFASNGQIGDASTYNDDVWGILALSAAGEASSDAVIEGAKTFIISNQNTDGGWGWAVGQGSDSNDTASAMSALLQVGVPKTDAVIVSAVNYLKSAQNTDGGFTYDPTSQWGTASDTNSDAWVISAIYKLGENPTDSAWTKDGHTATEHLNSMQNAGGYFGYQSSAEDENGFSAQTTAQAVIALAGKSYPIIGSVVTVPPTASPIAGTYTSAQSVTLTSSGASSIHYTTNGTNPTCSTGLVYSSPIAVNSSQTIKAVSCYPGDVSSSVASFVYTLTLVDGNGANVSLGSANAGEADLPTGAISIVLTNTTVLNLSAGLSGDAVILQSGVDTQPIVLTNSNLAGISASIPDGTKIQGPAGWDGKVTPPVAGTPNGGSAPTGFSLGSTVISVGSPDGTLFFDSPVTILLAGVTGAVGYRPSGSNTWQTITTCGGSYDTPTLPIAPGECAISNGTDTKIVTYHFTSFGSLTPVPSGGGGGGGGGGGDTIPPTSTSVSINAGVAEINTTSVTLILAATDAYQMLVSNTSDFTGASWEAYVTSKAWVLTAGEGTKTVYAKFRDLAGNISSAVSDTIAFSLATIVTPVVPATPATPAVPATQIEGCVSGNLFSTTSGMSCAVSATPAVPATTTTTTTTAPAALKPLPYPAAKTTITPTPANTERAKEAAPAQTTEKAVQVNSTPSQPQVAAVAVAGTTGFKRLLGSFILLLIAALVLAVCRNAIHEIKKLKQSSK